MELDISPKHIESIESSAVLQQTGFWAKVKKNQGCLPRAFDINIKTQDFNLKKETDKNPDNATDDLLVVLQRIGAEQYIANIPYGPVMEPEEDVQGVLLEELSESLIPFLPRGCVLIRYDLRWESQWSHDETRFDEEKEWLGPPDPAIQEMRMNFNTCKSNLRKTYSDNLPSNTIFIDLKKDTGDLLKKMKPKTRYNIQLSQRKGVEVKDVTEKELSVWYDMYRQTAVRNRIYLHDISYFDSILQAKKTAAESKTQVYLLMAVAGDTPLAGMFLVLAGGRATYLYGASSMQKRNLMGAYALQWEAIKKAKAKGCREYDMFGVSQPALPSHPLYGLYRFKSGFGGYLYHRMGCWDYPLNNEEYEIFRAAELNSQGYHIK